MSRSRNWCWTLNLEGPGALDDDLHLLCWRPPVSAPDGVRYLCAQREIGESGNNHWQGYVEFTGAVSMAGAKKRLRTNRVHIEARLGTQEEAVNYTRKDGGTDWFELGVLTINQSGKRNDLDLIRERLDGGTSMATIASEHFGPWCRYRAAFQSYATLRQSIREEKPKTSYYFGPPGSGKTAAAFASVDARSVYFTSFVRGQNAWMDGYDPLVHTTVIIDDFNSSVQYGVLLRILDRYPLWLPVKGGSVNFVAKNIVITSNLRPEMQYPSVYDVDRFAFYRRVDSFLYFPALGVTPEDRTDLYRVQDPSQLPVAPPPVDRFDLAECYECPE